MFRRAISGLSDPGTFFRWLAAQPPRLAPGFGVVLLGILISMGTSAWILSSGDSPLSSQLQSALSRAGITPGTVAVGLLAMAPLAALVTWVAVWIPIRVGAGSAERLFEVAAWSQLPQLVLSAAQACLAMISPGLPLLVAPVMQVAGLAWCTWFVHAGVKHTSRGNAVGAAVAYAIFWLFLVALRILLGPSSGSQGSGTLMS